MSWQFYPFKITREFEPQGWGDYALIPWWAARYVFAYLWFWSRNLAWMIRRWRRDVWFADGGRHISLDPICCPRCLWSGPYRWLCHRYQDDGSGEDVEPSDECPRCGLEI
jgi:hypothetical protein